MNAHSSRSHCVLSLTLTSRSARQLEGQEEGGRQDERVLSSTLHLVDLAGSERASQTNAKVQAQPPR